MKYQHIIYLIAILLGLFLGCNNTEGKLDFLVERNAERAIKDYDGWRTNLNLARDDQGALMRAIVAKIGLGANTKEEAIYLSTGNDGEGIPLDSKNDYEIIIENEIPVDAFWSITVYGADDYLIENEFDKYGVSSFQELKYKEDGTLRILLSEQAPDDKTNWIPLPAESQPFTVILRCYKPKTIMQNELEKVDLPLIKKLSNS